MGQTNSGCDCSNEDFKYNLDSYIDTPSITKEDVSQIWKCFEYLKPTNGVVKYNKLLRSKDSAPVYMNEIIDTMLSSHSDVSFDDFFFIMKPKVLSVKSKNNGVLLESNSTSVSCILCPYKPLSNLT